MEREAAPSFTLTRQTSQLQIKIVMPREGRVRRLAKEKSICVPMVPQSQHHGNKRWCFASLNLNENLFICLYLFLSAFVSKDHFIIEMNILIFEAYL